MVVLCRKKPKSTFSDLVLKTTNKYGRFSAKAFLVRGTAMERNTCSYTPPHFYCFSFSSSSSSFLLFFLLPLIFIVFPPPPPYFYCFPSSFSSTTSSSFLLFSLLLLLHHLLLISIVFPRKGQRGQNQAITFEFGLLGLILTSLVFSRENNRNEEEEGKH